MGVSNESTHQVTEIINPANAINQMAVIGVRPVTMTAKSAVFAVKGEVMKDTHFLLFTNLLPVFP